MDDMESQLSKYLRLLGPVPRITLGMLRDKKTLGKDALPARVFDVKQWIEMLSLAEHLGFGTTAYLRNERVKEEEQMLLLRLLLRLPLRPPPPQPPRWCRPRTAP